MTKRNWIALGMILFPVFLFYGLLASQTVNLPFLDDYTSVLGFMCNWVRAGTISGKLNLILNTQFNEYKLIFAQAIFATQYSICGKVNFAILSTIGNFLALPVILILYWMWKADRRTIQERLLLFAPVSWLLYQFQYYSLLDWPMSSLQNIAVILFSLLAIYLLSRNETRSFYLSLLSLVLAICSSGNGFFVIPIGCLMLFQFRSFPRLVIWTAASMTMVALYFGKYDYLQSQAHADHSVLSSIHHLSPLYALSFLGSSIASYSSYIPAAALGVCLCVVFLFAIVDRFYSKNPAMFYSICFLLITAIAVSGLRSDFGISQSLVSRYRIYSNLALIFTYLYLVGRFQSRVTGPMIRRFALVAIMVAAVGFNLGSTYAGFKLLRIRTDLTVEGIRRWEHGEESITTAAGPANEDAVIKRQRLHGNYQPSDFELRQAGSLNVYIPPAL